MLHYAGVHEVYNIIEVAAAGETGNPDDYRDFAIKAYRANQTQSVSDLLWHLEADKGL
ncbi:MAG: hypothetical protein NT028_08225 [candidate division Zixibacteria bacterium]|nr:hypothetical protein [candidate division Zixibacteria bacterium]